MCVWAAGVVWGVFGGGFEFKFGQRFGGGVGCVLGLSSDI